MLSGTLFPYHPKPRPDELLSSWIVRTALGHGQRPHGFCSAVWPSTNVWTRDVDSLVPPVLLAGMARRTATPLERAEQTTLASLEGELFEFHFPNGRTKWILRGGIYHRLRRNPWLQYCPHCLAEDEEPYYRRSWRLAFVATCSKHSVVLNDRCPMCESPLMPYRAKEIHLCHACQFDLRNAPAEPAYFPALAIQRQCEATLGFGWGKQGEFWFLRSILFFDLLHQVLRVISTGPRSGRLREFIASRWGGNATPPTFPAGSREFEALGSEDRHRTLGLAFHVLDGWPWKFVGACAEAGVWHSWAMRDCRKAPYAYEEPISRFLRHSLPAS
jgi:hypothetical protein